MPIPIKYRASATPIETTYNGFRFRSRAEARWAVFFDAAGIRYQYEPEGVKLSDGTLYLPDFFLPDCKTWFEVKGVLNDIDKHKVEQLIVDSKMPVVVGYADLTFTGCDNWSYEDDPHFTMTDKSTSLLCCCEKCKKYWFMGTAGIYTCLNCGAYDGDGHFYVPLYGDGYTSSYDKNDPIIKAYGKARKARFEYGENPIIT